MRSHLIVGACALLLATSTFAQTSDTIGRQTAPHPTAHAQTEIAPLTPQEDERYQALMQQGAARWYSHLHPLEVLGIYATTAMERQQYALKVAKLRTERVAREIAFQQALDIAHQQTYSTLAPIASFAATDFATPFTPADLQAGDRLWWILEDAPSPTQLQSLLTVLDQHPLVTLTLWSANPMLQQTLQRQWRHQPRVTAALRNRQMQWAKQPPTSLSAALYHARQTHIRPFELNGEENPT